MCRCNNVIDPSNRRLKSHIYSRIIPRVLVKLIPEVIIQPETDITVKPRLVQPTDRVPIQQVDLGINCRFNRSLKRFLSNESKIGA